MNFWLNRSDRVILSVVILLGVLAFAHTPLTEFFQGILPGSGGATDYEPRPIKLEDVTVKLPEMRRERKVIYLNEASVEDLKSLEGVGPVLADRIVSFREDNGGFTSIEELTKVEGIGPSKLAGIKEFIEVKD